MAGLLPTVLKDLRVGRVIKLHEGDDPGGLLGLALTDAAPHTNAGKMSCRVVVSTQGVDRSNDVVVSKGIDLTDHRRLPVVLLNHNKDYPVGYAEDPAGSYTVRLDGDTRLVAETYFSKTTKIGEQAFRLVESGVLRGASIGFLPVPGTVEKSHAGGRLFKAARLCEYSHLVLPDNPEAVVIAVEKGFDRKPLCPELLNILKPLVPERNPVVRGGWESPVTVTKAFPDDDTPAGGAAPDPMDPAAPAAGPPADPAAADPHAEHDEIIHDATEQQVFALWSKFRKAGLSVADTLDKIKVALEANENLRGGPADADADLDLDADEDEDEDADPDADADLDLNDDHKERAEKAMREVWVKAYQGPIGRVAAGLAQIAGHPNPCPRKVQAAARKLIGCMEALPEIDGVIAKALAAPPARPADDLDEVSAAVLPILEKLNGRITAITG